MSASIPLYSAYKKVAAVRHITGQEPSQHMTQMARVEASFAEALVRLKRVRCKNLKYREVDA